MVVAVVCQSLSGEVVLPLMMAMMMGAGRVPARAPALPCCSACVVASLLTEWAC